MTNEIFSLNLPLATYHLPLFLSPDPAGTKAVTLTDPQTWNMYAYVRNNPTTLTDPTGMAPCCDFNDIMDFATGAINAYVSDNLLGAYRNDQSTEAGQIGGAVGDSVATATGAAEIVVGGGGEVAGTALDLTGVGALLGVPVNVVAAGVMAHGAVTAGEGYVHLAKSATSGETDAAAAGREAHKDFADKVGQKPGWQSEPRVTDPATGKTVKPDAITKSGRPVELKPNTVSGQRAGARQLKKYQRATGKNGRVVYYDQ